MSFLYPYVLLALILPLALAVGIIISHRHAGAAWCRLVSPAHPELVHCLPRWRVGLPIALALLALTGIILAAARPINGYGQSEATATGRNLIIALDISRSMETQDVSPSRIEEARAAAYELIEALPGDKIGLIVFAGEADVVVPLTYDHTALRDALEQVNRDWAGYGGTNFGLLLRTAMQNFARSAPDGANALVILSDGEDTVDSSLEIAEEARKNNLLVITVGIGTPVGAPIPDPQGENGLWQDASGRHVISKLDIAALRRFAEATGGDFFTMSSGADLAAFARQAAEKLERHEESYAAGREPLDLFVWFAFPSLLALLASIIIGSEWRAPRHTSALLILALLCCPAAQAATAPEAYAQALESLSKGETTAAGEQLSEALLSNDPALQAAVHLALGNMRTRATFDKLRKLYEPEEGDSAAPASPSIEQLQSIVDELRGDLTPYRDAIEANASYAAPQQNIDRIEDFIKKLEEEIERLKQQQQNQQQQDQNQQQDNNQQQDQNQQQSDSDQNQDKQQDQPQKDRQDSQQDQQSSPDRQEQQQGDQNDSDDKQQGQDRQRPQDAPDEQNNGNTPQEQEQNQKDNGQAPQDSPEPSEQDLQQAEAQAAELSEDEKNKQRAAGILRMHLDEEKGSPIPHFNRAVRPPAKDY